MGTVTDMFRAVLRGQFKAWALQFLDKKLRKISYTMRGEPEKDPNCKDPMCGPKGIRRDMRLGKLMGGGALYCCCVRFNSDEKDRINVIRRWLGLTELR